MIRLNRDAADALLEIDVRWREKQVAGSASPIHAVTDVTGFGLLGHAREMALGSEKVPDSKVSLELDSTKIDALPGALDAARAGHLSGGLKNNIEFLGGCVEFAESVPEEVRHLLYDPQTSGGLLVAVAGDASNAALDALEKRNVPARLIGHSVTKRSPLIFVG
jgi:selenide,water dikinase